MFSNDNIYSFSIMCFYQCISIIVYTAFIGYCLFLKKKNELYKEILPNFSFLTIIIIVILKISFILVSFTFRDYNFITLSLNILVNCCFLSWILTNNLDKPKKLLKNGFKILFLLLLFIIFVITILGWVSIHLFSQLKEEDYEELYCQSISEDNILRNKTISQLEVYNGMNYFCPQLSQTSRLIDQSLSYCKEGYNCLPMTHIDKIILGNFDDLISGSINSGIFILGEIQSLLMNLVSLHLANNNFLDLS